MSKANYIENIPFTKERAVIINCGTRLSTTLAILSSLRYLDMPVLLVDCPIDKLGVSDFLYFSELKSIYSFDLVQLPLHSHGDTLDYLFLNLNAEYICLIDSDIEILNRDAIKQMRLFADSEKLFSQNEKIFGSGFLQVSGKGLPPQEKWFHIERMWIPFTYLNVSLIKRALNQGHSFNILHVYNDFPMNQRISKKLFYIIEKIQKKSPLFIYPIVDSICNFFRKSYENIKPSLFAYDTGAKIYETLKEQGFLFIGISFYVTSYYCTHFCGLTRYLLNNSEPVAVNIFDVSSYIKMRLYKEYDFDFDKYHIDLNSKDNS